MTKEDEKIQKQLVDEMMKVSKTNPDVMIYMQALMESYEKLEQEIDRLNNLNKQLVEECQKLDDEVTRLDNIINELEKWLDEYYKSNRKWYNTELSAHDMQYYREYYINTEFMIVKFLNKLKELKELKNE